MVFCPALLLLSPGSRSAVTSVSGSRADGSGDAGARAVADSHLLGGVLLSLRFFGDFDGRTEKPDGAGDIQKGLIDG